MAHAADTHLHAGFLSGARQLAASERTFDHAGLGDGDEADGREVTTKDLPDQVRRNARG